MRGVFLRGGAVLLSLAGLLFIATKAAETPPGTETPSVSVLPVVDIDVLLRTQGTIHDAQRHLTTSAVAASRPAFTTRKRTRIAFKQPLLGLHTTAGPWDMDSYLRLERQIGRRAAILEWPVAFADPFPRRHLSLISTHGSLPMITWEPWSYRDPRPRTFSGPNPSQPIYSLRTFKSGNHDAYLRSFARGMKEFGRPVMIRFAPEMNGWWNSWSEELNGNRRGEYVQAWRHVVDLFEREGATNVLWVWSPNIVYTGGGLPAAQDLEHFYPGDEWVDIIGFDGYNWGTTQNWSKWHGFDAVFGTSFKTARSFSKRPLFISETASTEVGGEKAEWIRDLFAGLKRNPDVIGFVWFNRQKETDWRIESSPESLQAFSEEAESVAQQPNELIEYLYRRAR